MSININVIMASSKQDGLRFKCKKRIIPKLVMLFSSVLASTAGYAVEDDDFTKLSLAELLNVEVFTPSKQRQSLRDTPASTIVVTQQQIRMRGYRNLVDLLEMLPGFDIQRRSESNRINDITMRGQFKHRRFLILQDGVQIDSPDDDILAIADNYPLYHAKQVEIVYGPNSALWGTDAFGGVINIISQNGGDLNGGKISMRRGDDDFRYNQFMIGTELDEWSLIAGGHKHSSTNADLSKAYPDYFGPVDALTFDGDVYRAAADREAFLTPEKTESLFLRADYEDMLTFGVQHHRIEELSSNGVMPVSGLYDADAKIISKNTTLYAALDYSFSDELNSKTTFDYGVREVLPETLFKQIYTGFVDSYKYARGERAGIDQQFTYQWSDEQNITFGLVYQDFSTIARSADTGEQYDPALPPGDQQLYYLNTDLPIDVIQLDYSNAASYFQLQSDWSDELSSTLGVRYDKHSEFGSSINPRMGLVYHASEKNTWKLLYGEAFRAPSVAEATTVYGSFEIIEGKPVSGWMQVPNLDLGPEKLRSLEVAFSHYWNHGSFDASMYYTEVKDLIATVKTADPIQFVAGGEITKTVTPANLDDASYYGVDLWASYRLDLDAGIKADLWGSYSYIDGELGISSSGLDVEPNYIANHKLRLGLTFSLWDRYFITPKLRINSETNTNSFVEEGSTTRIKAPGYGVVDINLAAERLFGVKGLAGRLDIYNLFDRRFFNAGGQGPDAYFAAKPQPQLSWNASLEYNFDL